MKNEPLKVYTTKSFYSDVTISILEDKVLIDDDNYEIEKSFKEVLFTDYFSLSIDTETEYKICLFLCDLLKEISDLPDNFERILNFYHHYNPELIETFTYINQSADCSIHVNQQLNLTPYGLEIWEYDRMSMLVRPDRLFFAGPYAKCLPLERRMKLKNIVFKALGDQNCISKEDGFPMINYEAFEKDKYFWDTGDWNKGAKLSIEKGSIYNEGWSSPRDGGAQSFNLEWILYFGKAYFNLLTNREFDDKYDAICDILRKHIIKRDSIE